MQLNKTVQTRPIWYLTYSEVSLQRQSLGLSVDSMVLHGEVHAAFLCPQSDMKTTFVEEKSGKRKTREQVSVFVTLLMPGVCTCSVAHRSTGF